MILVTGGTGLVGAHLLLELTKSGQQVRALYRSEKSLAKTRTLFAANSNPHFNTIEWLIGDITDIPSLGDAFQGIETVYHCAACVSFEPSDEELLRKVNIEGTANMVNCAFDFGVKKFCHVSSIAALGDPKENEIITEETDWNPEVRHSDYAISKYGAEMEVWRAWQEGLNVVIVNPGIIFGKGFWESGSGVIFKTISNGQSFYAEGSCGIIAVEDVVKAMTQLMATSINGERYTLIAENMSYKDIMNSIADNLKAKHPSIQATPIITSIGWRLDWFLSKLLRQKRRLTQSMARSSHNRETYDNSKIKETLDFTFVPPSVFLKQLAEDYRASL
ncbi:NAD-dependent epimerase/dehydratase family protein [Flavobacterium sp. AG291]|uniref:NAD-dependent epimerase/dehydratase family protein n=1 Tax=Flavobacterium sp. AG291 TaxID=2184000 RepID=UPI000E0A8C79|nr:NAD-dependent epimerase/dehydratase family protein [Flavobacterium sp. AG291]RDI15736.1 nucleoside-diphosphate-sugar epimerase [Flavobacterium sp. AG291]